MKYFDELKRSMTWLGEQQKSYFIGQSVQYEGTAMFNTLIDVPMEKRLELPVVEEMQMGMSIGLALEGFIPISIFPRLNFLLLAVNQLVNHLDKISLMSKGGYQPKVIIRTGIGSEVPLDPFFQHKGDFTRPLQSMLKTVEVIKLEEPEDIFSAYEYAYNRDDGRSTLLIEVSDYLNSK